LARDGVARLPSQYDPAGLPISRALLEDARHHDLLGGMVEIAAPIHVVQGMRDPDVPYAHALALMERLSGGPATLTLIRDGDHRLSRPQDIAVILRAAEGMG
ncbi:MAG: alpha/beta hydrolase, partial [Hyphomicrobiales bacterium]|nr:alpha/beta hydrolase [Hyphomicrobiales bacterium]